MAQATSPTAGSKRGPGRPMKGAQPALKKTRLQSPLSSAVQSPTVGTPTFEKRSNKLPHKTSETRPLPTLPEPQSATLSASDFQTIASSAVLQASLDRSRLKWINEGVLERYWVKPESGKNARPPPPKNPDVKLQKLQGPCRIRIEPHILEVEIFVEEKPKPAPVKQYAPPASAWGQPYKQGPQQHVYGGQQNQYYQNRALPPMQQPAPALSPAGGMSPAPRMTQSPQPPSVSRAQQPPASSSPAPSQGDKKASPDPVITMLANRASSDPELKGLMKEVATGHATPAQLKIFQNHIDELTKVIAEKKKKDEATEAATQAAKDREQQSDIIQYDGSNEAPPQAPPPRPQPYQQPYQPQQQTWQPPPRPIPPAPTTQPVIIAFTTPGATEDRFLFPQHAILETLSPQHLLVSFIVTRRGSKAVDSTDLDPAVEYWQPVTLMVEVAYNREHLIECVKKWVKPAEEVRKYMEGVMERCTRASEGWLALRLPHKGSKEAAEPEEVLGEGGEEVVFLINKDVERKRNVKYVKKAPAVKKEDGGKGVEAGKGKVEGKVDEGAAAEAGTSAVPAEQKDGAVGQTGDEGKGEGQETTESGRPRRAVRKSVRISEG